jgi:hypothetical protein
MQEYQDIKFITALLPDKFHTEQSIEKKKRTSFIEGGSRFSTCRNTLNVKYTNCSSAEGTADPPPPNSVQWMAK